MSATQAYLKSIKPRRSSLSILVNNLFNSFTVLSAAPPSPADSVSSDKSDDSYVSAMETEYVSFPEFDDDAFTSSKTSNLELQMEPYLEISMVC